MTVNGTIDDDDSGFDDLELLSGRDMAAASAAVDAGGGDLGAAGGATATTTIEAGGDPAGGGGGGGGGSVADSGGQAQVDAAANAAATQRSYALRDLAVAAGYEGYNSDDADDQVVMRDFGAALEEVRSYQSPEFQQRLAALQEFEQQRPSFEAWRQGQVQGQGQPQGQGQGRAPSPAAPAAADPNDPFAPWSNVPEYAGDWENICEYNPQLGRFVYRQEFLAQMQKVGAVPDQSIPQKLTAYKEWEFRHGRDAIRNLPKLLEAHSQRQYESFEKRILEKVNGRDSEKETERRLQAVVANDIADYFEVDPATNQIRRAANGALLRTPLGHFFHRRSVEAQENLFPGVEKKQLTAANKVVIHNYAKQLAHADFMIWQAQQGNAGGTAPAANPAQAPSATAQAPAARPAAPAAAPAQKLAPDDPQRQFLDGAAEEARSQSSAGGGRDANLRRSQNAADDDDDDHDFSETYDDTPKKVASRLAREHAQAGANGFAPR